MGFSRVAGHFTFDAVWHLPEPAARVFDVLAAADDYGLWWPQIRSVHRIDEVTGTAVVRSLLPLPLHLRMTQLVRDEAIGRLVVELGEDLDGWARWDVAPAPGGSVATWRQEVDVRGRWLRLGARLAPAVLRGNHEWMMRSGERGLRDHLAVRR
ncbi:MULTISPECIES: SRPBCC family protein [unclassified Janibacter]|uniref:SRPBCC family protein n=1 Tax=unclassified Janibacter TaxID=2649294 RepID=UPI003D00B1D1